MIVVLWAFSCHVHFSFATGALRYQLFFCYSSLPCYLYKEKGKKHWFQEEQV